MRFRPVVHCQSLLPQPKSCNINSIWYFATGANSTGLGEPHTSVHNRIYLREWVFPIELEVAKAPLRAAIIRKYHVEAAHAYRDGCDNRLGYGCPDMIRSSPTGQGASPLAYSGAVVLGVATVWEWAKSYRFGALYRTGPLSHCT